MATTADITISVNVTGLAEGGSDQNHFSIRNSTAVRVALETTAGAGIANATTLSNHPNARVMIIVPPPGNASPMRFSGTTAEVGLPLSSVGPSVITIPPSTASNSYVLYTTAASGVSGVRVLYY